MAQSPKGTRKPKGKPEKPEVDLSQLRNDDIPARAGSLVEKKRGQLPDDAAPNDDIPTRADKDTGKESE